MAEQQAQPAAPAPAPAPAPAAPAPAAQAGSADAEFSALMGTFRIFVILSILFDILFIFTILSFVKKGELKAKAPYVSPQLQSEFNTWSTIFIIALIVRIILVFGSVCLSVFGVFSFIPWSMTSYYSY